MFFNKLEYSNLNYIQSVLSEAEKEGASMCIKKNLDFLSNEKLSMNNFNVHHSLNMDSYNQNACKENYNVESRNLDSKFDFRDKYFKTFPIRNDNFNFLIVDSNLAIKDNLQNIFFIEFDLNKDIENYENIKIFTEINNEKVNKEIDFILNVFLFFILLLKKYFDFKIIFGRDIYTI